MNIPWHHRLKMLMKILILSLQQWEVMISTSIPSSKVRKHAKKKQQQEQIRDVIELFFSFVQMLVMFSSLTEHISGFYLFDITYYQSMFHIFSPCWWQELQRSN